MRNMLAQSSMIKCLRQSARARTRRTSRHGCALGLLMICIITLNCGNQTQLSTSFIFVDFSGLRCKTENLPHLCEEHVCVIPRRYCDLDAVTQRLEISDVGGSRRSNQE